MTCKKTKHCKECKKFIPKGKDPRKQFCNRSCAATFNNRKYPKRKKLLTPGGTGLRKTCLVCGKRVSKNASTYCSNQCQRNHAWVLREAEFDAAKEITGLIFATTGRVAKPTNAIAKKYLIQKRGVACEICKDTEHNFGGTVVPMPLILDHIDGSSDNWKLSNLRLVCGRCDMLLPTYKNKNLGNGRHYRRQRYAQGKSY